MNSKIPAYTLTEVLIVLAISAIVMGLAFSVLDIVKQNVYEIREKNEHNSKIQSLELTLRHNFNEHREIEYLDKIKTLRYSEGLGEKTMVLKNDSIFVSMNAKGIRIKKAIFFLRGLPVKEGRIDALKLYLNSEHHDYLFVRQYNDRKTKR